MRSNVFCAALHALLIGLPLWLGLTLIWLPLLIVGLPLVAWLSWREAWHLEASKRYPNRFPTIAVWNARWANYLFGNDEDGVTGDQRWWPTYCEAKGWKDLRLQAFVWSALRNPVNNFRFTRLVDIGNDRIKQLRYVGNSDDCSLDLQGYRVGVLRHTLFWFYSWTGPYPAFWIICARADRTHARLRLGWKFTPAFRNGIPSGDYREQSESFTPAQFGLRRAG